MQVPDIRLRVSHITAVLDDVTCGGDIILRDLWTVWHARCSTSDALEPEPERLRDEVRLRNCEVQRLLNCYGPVGHALGQFEYCRDETHEKQKEDSAWFSALPEHRRETIEARKWALDFWQVQLVGLHGLLYDRINLRKVWLESNSVLSIVLPSTDVIQIIWNYVHSFSFENLPFLLLLFLLE